MMRSECEEKNAGKERNSLPAFFLRKVDLPNGSAKCPNRQ